MTIGELKKILTDMRIDDGKEIVIVAQEGRGVYELWAVTDCEHDQAVLFNARPPTEKEPNEGSQNAEGQADGHRQEEPRGASADIHRRTEGIPPTGH